MYAAFNERDIDGVLDAMTPDVDWPNGWEGGRVLGREAVRDYWSRQWAQIDPRVDPVLRSRPAPTDGSRSRSASAYRIVTGTCSPTRS